GREGCLAPAEPQARAGLPCRHPADLEDLAGGARLDQPAALARLEGEPARRPIVKRNRSFGCHHRPISRVKTSKARSALALTRKEPRMREVTIYAPLAP